MSSPHEPIATRYRSPLDKPEYVDGLFRRGASHYDLVTKLGFFGTGNAYRRRALKLAGLERGMRVVDVACGTGAVTREALELVGPEGEVLGVDPNEGMLAEARMAIDTEFVVAGAEELPLPDADRDFLSMGFALRHVGSLDRTFEEYLRVLRPGGRLCVLEISRPRSRFGLLASRFYFRDVIPGFSKLVTGSEDAREMMSYYWETIDACVPPEKILAAIEGAGFREVKRRIELGIFSAYEARR